MKKGLIIIGLALLAVFLFWEGQRKGLNTLAMSAKSATDFQNEKISAQENHVGAAAKLAPSREVAMSSSAPNADVPASQDSAVPQMQTRQRVPLEYRLKNSKTFLPEPSELRDSELFKSTQWKVWVGVHALTDAEARKNTHEVLGRYSGYVVVKDGDEGLDENNFTAKNPFVVFDQRMGVLGIVPGRVEIKVKDNSSLMEMQREYNFKILDSFDQLRVYFVTASASEFNLIDFVEVLKKDPRVEKAELEVVSRNYVQN